MNAWRLNKCWLLLLVSPLQWPCTGHSLNLSCLVRKMEMRVMLMIKPESKTALQSVVCVQASLWGCALPSVRCIEQGVSSAHAPLSAEARPPCIQAQHPTLARESE